MLEWGIASILLRDRRTLVAFVLGGIFLAVTSVLNAGNASRWQIVVEESAKLLGVVCFLLGHLAAFSGTVEELRPRLGYEEDETFRSRMQERPRHAVGFDSHG